jgi:tripeptide aminopeptidase
MKSTNRRILEMAIEIQQIPAPTFHEEERANFVWETFQLDKELDVRMDDAGNVLACLRGSGKAAPIVVSAHLDTVFPHNINLKYSQEDDRIFGPGIGDNSTGVAALFGVLWMLKERNIHLPGDLWLAANVCEEGLGDLKGIRAIVNRFKDQPQAYIILEGMALGHIFNRGLGVRRYRISITTRGGHSWSDYGQPSAVHELSNLATRITGLVLPSTPRTTLNIGKIIGGTSVNTIAAEASMDLDLRSEKMKTLEKVAQKVEQLAASVQKEDIQVEIKQIGARPAGEIKEDHPLVMLAQDCIREQGLQPVLTIGSTDANLPLRLGYPAITIGLTYGASAHTVHEYIYTDPLEKGMEQLLQLITRLAAG